MKLKLIKDYESYKAESIIDCDELTAKELKEKEIAVDYIEDEAKVEEVIEKEVEKQIKKEKNMTIEVKDEARKPFEGIGEFLKAVVDAGSKGIVDPRLKASGQNETTAADGGYLVQHELFTGTVFGQMMQDAVIAPKCQKVEVGPYSNGLKINSLNETGRAQTSLFGGLRFYAPNEGIAKTASKVTFDQTDISLKKLCAVLYCTDELLQDVPAMETYLGGLVGKGFAWNLDNEILNGTLSVCNPIVNDDATVEVTFAGDHPTAAELVQFWRAVAPSARQRGEFYLSNDQANELMVLGTTGTFPLYQANFADPARSTLFGRPINIIEQAGAATDESSFVFADFSQYLLITKGGIKMDSSISVKFLEDETAFRWVMRVGGAPALYSKVTLPDSTIVSPFVTRD